jgi:hypothetical protein
VPQRLGSATLGGACSVKRKLSRGSISEKR